MDKQMNNIGRQELIVLREKMGGHSMTDYEKLEWVHSAIQEAQNGNTDGLETALGLVEDVRENVMGDNDES